MGGTLAYSTCSLNPIEDEAVVAGLLASAGGALQLLDGAHLLPGLARRPGLRRWLVLDDQARLLQSVAHARRADGGTNARGECRYRSTMWPPSASESAPELERCMRFLPHLNNGGGFFIALLRKVAPLPAPRRCSGVHAEAPARQRAARLAAARAAGHELRPMGAAELAEVRRGLGLDHSAFTTGGTSPAEQPQLFTRSPAAGRAAEGTTEAPVGSGCVFAVAPRVAEWLRSEPGRLAVVHAGTAIAKRRRGVWKELEPALVRTLRRGECAGEDSGGGGGGSVNGA